MTERLKPLRGEGAKLLKMVAEATDLATLEQALELANAIGQPAEGLLEGVQVTAAGELLPSSRFRGTQATQATLDLLLVHQLSLAPAGSPEAQLRQSVRHLALSCPLLAPLRGFDGLETLELTVPAGAQWTDLSAWGPLPALRTLSITQAGTKDRPACLLSLEGLHAPALETANLKALGLTRIDALAASSALSEVDLAENPALASIDALASSAASLTTLNLEACAALGGIGALAGAASLRALNLQGCARVTSLQPLAASAGLAQIDLADCASLVSLEGLCPTPVGPSRYRALSLKGCASLRSLRGLPPLNEEVESLQLQDMPELASLDGIEAARGIETLVMEDLALTNLDGLSELTRLTEVSAVDCKDLEDVRVLGRLPALVQARVSGSPKLARLPEAWGDRLESLELFKGVYTAIGRLPASLKKLSVREARSLHDLQGVEGALALKEISVDTYLRDASALNGLPLACVCCSGGTAGAVTPAWVHSALGMLKPLRLDLRSANLKDLQFLLELPDLQQLHVDYQSCQTYGFKGYDHLTEAAVRTLQRVVCKKHQLALPAFLKPRRASTQAAAPGGPSLADLKRGLTSTDFHEVVAAVNALRTSGDAGLHDAVLEGVHAPTLYTGDTASLGKIFRDIRAPYRPWARWALTHVLMDAPPTSASAQALCNTIESITLSVSPVHRRQTPGPLAWGRFKALKSLTLEGIADQDLSYLSEVASLQSLSLKGLAQMVSLQSLAAMKALPTLHTLKLEECKALQSLEGLQGATRLEMITASGCEALRDFSAMSGLQALRVFPGWSLRSPRIDFASFGALTDIGFVTGLRGAEAIELKLQGRVDLSALAQLPQLQALSLELDTLEQDFSPLSGLRKLQIDLIDPATGYSSSPQGKPQPGQSHAWRGEFPLLETLRVTGGAHDLSQLRAPALTAFEGYSRLTSLKGVGHAAKLTFYLADCESLDGLAGSPVTSLDLHYLEKHTAKLPSFAVIHEVPNLHTLRIAPTLTPQHARELTGCVQVQCLQAHGYRGSLAFLAGWTQLAEIDLRDSGELTDLEMLCTLPSLTLVRLRGAALKRESWPKALQDRLDFRST